jgi:short-subunit dehydrogenase
MKRINFKDKKVLITGASTGIGKALAREFAARGAVLALNALPEEKNLLDDLAQQLEKDFNAKVWTFPINLLDDEGPENLYQQVNEKVGDIFALVNNAGISSYGNFTDIPLQRQVNTIKLNVIVSLSMMHRYLKDMVKRKEGVIFNVSSVAALQATPFHAVYGASKAALQGLSEAVRQELKGSGVTVCTLNPTFIQTPLLDKAGYPEDMRFYAVNRKKDVDWVARKAIRAFEKQKFIYLPGLWTWFLHMGAGRVTPRRLVNAMARYFMQRKKKKK